jgi:hypothetical protein
LDFGSLDGWQQFVAASARSENGRRAMQAYRTSKRIALGTEAKLGALAQLLQRHRRERVLIFTGRERDGLPHLGTLSDSGHHARNAGQGAQRMADGLQSRPGAAHGYVQRC